MFHTERTSRSRLCQMSRGSSPMADRMTPTRIDSRMIRTTTDSGGPPRKRCTVSFGIGMVLHLRAWARNTSACPCEVDTGSPTRTCANGRTHTGALGFADGIDPQQALERLDAVGIGRPLVPAQP